MAHQDFAKCSCGTIIKLPNLKARAVTCDACYRALSMRAQDARSREFSIGDMFVVGDSDRRKWETAQRTAVGARLRHSKPEQDMRARFLRMLGPGELLVESPRDLLEHQIEQLLAGHEVEPSPMQDLQAAIDAARETRHQYALRGTGDAVFALHLFEKKCTDLLMRTLANKPAPMTPQRQNSALDAAYRQQQRCTLSGSGQPFALSNEQQAWLIPPAAQDQAITENTLRQTLSFSNTANSIASKLAAALGGTVFVAYNGPVPANADAPLCAANEIIGMCDVAEASVAEGGARLNFEPGTRLRYGKHTFARLVRRDDDMMVIGQLLPGEFRVRPAETAYCGGWTVEPAIITVF